MRPIVRLFATFGCIDTPQFRAFYIKSTLLSVRMSVLQCKSSSFAVEKAKSRIQSACSIEWDFQSFHELMPNFACLWLSFLGIPFPLTADSRSPGIRLHPHCEASIARRMALDWSSVGPGLLVWGFDLLLTVGRLPMVDRPILPAGAVACCG
jgi:hypothetical protein